jgi:hypothetical protein
MTRAVAERLFFDLVEGFKRKDNVDRNAVMVWERLKNKFEHVTDPSLVKLEKQFRQCGKKIKTLRFG